MSKSDISKKRLQRFVEDGNGLVVHRNGKTFDLGPGSDKSEESDKGKKKAMAGRVAAVVLRDLGYTGEEKVLTDAVRTVIHASREIFQAMERGDEAEAWDLWQEVKENLSFLSAYPPIDRSRPERAAKAVHDYYGAVLDLPRRPRRR